MNPNAELIRLYAKQLKIPTFAEYAEVLRRADPSADFAELLLELMKAETESRHEYSAKVEHPDRFELNSVTAQIEQSNRRN